MKNNRIKILCSAICVLISLAMLSGCLFSQNPVKYLADSVEESARSYFSDDANKLYDAMEKNGSIEIGLSSVPAELIGDSIDISNVKAKIYYAEDKTALELGAKISGKTYDLTATSNEKEITLSTSLLENAYGINLNNAKKNIKDNEFISGLIGNLGSEDDEDKLSIDDIIDSVKDSYNSAKQLKKFAENYEEKLKDIINKVCEVKKSSEKGGSVVSFTVTIEDATEILKQLYGEFSKDKKLRSFIEENFGEIIKQMGKMKIEDLYSVTDEQIQSFADEYTEKFKGYQLEGEVHVSGKKIVRSASFIVKDSSGNDFAKVEISLEGDVRSASLEYEGGYYSISYEIKADTKQEYKAVVNVTRKEGNTTVTVELGNISYNRETNAYTAVVYANNTPIEIKGTLEVSSSRARFTVNSVKSGEEEVFSGEFYVVLNAKDSMPSAAKGYTDVLTMKEEEFNELAGKLQALIPSVESD
ncbi:MAG: hypothetical protein J5830_03330 [Clostridia bacterium]|nr:hypothetical protein [Clostridia bacterium]